MNNGGVAIGTINTDGGSAPDYADTNSDQVNGGLDPFDISENATDDSIDLPLDADNNGIVDPDKFVDIDGDGLHDDFENGIFDNTDPLNATNNGQLPTDMPDVDDVGGDRDWREENLQDKDGDGIADTDDLDDDNDGILDTDEDFNEDGDGDPRTNPSDKDGDGIPNYFDLDSDNDGITDYAESGGTDDPDGNGQPGTGVLDNTEVNSNGIPLAVVGATATESIIVPINTSGSANADFVDLDSDNDGIPDTIEAGGFDPDGDGEYGAGTLNDEDADGLADALDPYDDRDGSADAPLPTAGTPLVIPDTDGDSIPNHLDLDSDDDTIPDNVEAQTTLGYVYRSENDTDEDGLDDNYDSSGGVGTGIQPVDTDGDGTPDYLDLDSDNDSLFDIVEAGNPTADTDADGRTNNTVGVNGFDNTYDNGDAYLDFNGIYDDPQTNFPDTDNDVNTGGDVDYRDTLDNDNDGVADADDLDDDNDGILDSVENGGTDPTVDSDNDGILDYRDADTAGFVDTNTDGVDDRFDTDLDGLIDQFDTDSDGDNCSDANEAYNDPNADADGNGYYGTGNPPAVNTDGTVTAATYPGTNANVTTPGAAPTITTQPADSSVNEGENTSFSVSATGTTLSYQWQVSTDGGSTFSNITDGGIYSGATTATLNLTAVAYANDGYQYAVVISDATYICDITTSNAAILNVNGIPVAVDDSNSTDEDVDLSVGDGNAGDLLSLIHI